MLKALLPGLFWLVIFLLFALFLQGCATRPQHGDESVGWNENPDGSLTIFLSKENNSICTLGGGCMILTNQAAHQIKAEYQRMKMMCGREI